MSISEMLLVFLVMTQDPGQGKIDEWIRRLGADEIETREQAQSELLKIGTPAAKSLRKASADPDLERAFRARTILTRIEGKDKASEEKPTPPLKAGSDDEEYRFWDPSSGRILRIRLRHLKFLDSWFWPFWGLVESHEI